MNLRSKCINRWPKLFAITLFCVALCAASPVEAKSPHINIVIGPQAPQLVKYAATELKGMLEHLFRVDVSINEDRPEDFVCTILLGQESTNPELSKALSQPLVQLSDQGFTIKTIDESPSRLMIRGGSTVATLWAVYELGERLGIRYLSDRDVYPTAEPTAWKPFPKLDIVMEPNQPIRCWRLVNEHAMGPAAWSLEENKRFIKQLAKMKFNRILVQAWPMQPFVKFSFEGVTNGPGVMFFGWKFPIDENTIGRERFGKMTEFTNPDFVGAANADEVQERAHNLMHGIIQQAKDLGFDVELGLMPTEWPKKYLDLIPGAQLYPDGADLTCGPGAKTSVTDPKLRDMITTVIRSYIEAYPQVDSLRLEFPELPVWHEQAEECYQRLAKKYDFSAMGSFSELCAKAHSRTNFPGGGQRVELSMREGLASLDLLDDLIHERALLKRPGGGPDISLSYALVGDDLLPLLSQLLPPGGNVIGFIDYTASRQLKHVDILRQPSIKNVPHILLMTLADDNVGVLPQNATGSIHKLLAEMRANNWSGFSTRYWNIAEQDPTLHYLSRACWDAYTTPEQAYEDIFSTVCGSKAAGPALEALALVEQVTLRLDQHGLGFAFPVKEMMTKHGNTSGLTEELKEDRNLYRRALEKMQRAQAASKPEGKFLPAYFAARLDFAVHYLDACDEYGIASAELKADHREAALQHANLALAAIDAALKAEVYAARDHGELGAVATMHEFCRKPIQQLFSSCQAKDQVGAVR